jgi:ribosomal protein RSM22 (predicted rRNA methylase)
MNTMSLKIPPEIERVLKEMLGINTPKGKRFESLKAGAVRLSDGFIKGEWSEGDLEEAYLFYHFPMNLMKVRRIIAELVSRHPSLFGERKSIRVLDAGCGEGAGMLGALYAFSEAMPESGVELTGLDASEQMLRRCSQIFKALGAGGTLKELKNGRISSGKYLPVEGEFDLILFANSIVEAVDGDIPTGLVEEAFNKMPADGVLVIMEPALKSASRRLMRLRHALLKEGVRSVLMPCLHAEPCPLLDIRWGAEWCHQSVKWSPPDFIRAMKRDLGRDADLLKYSYLVISAKKHPEENARKLKVVSDLIEEKGRLRAFLCTPAGRVELIRADNKATPANSAMDGMKRGDSISIKGQEEREPHRWMVQKETELKIDNRHPGE